MDQHAITRLQRALAGTNPENPRTKVVDVRVTTKQLHPTGGSTALRARLANVIGTATVSSLNAAGGGRKLIWGMRGFGCVPGNKWA